MGFFSGLGGIGKAIGIANPLTLGLGALTSFGSSAMDYMSAQKQNESAEVMAKNSMAFSASQAQQQMDFQERMSGTAHQREVEDLRAAGLNPLLSLNSGASTPGGASGTGAQGPVVPELSAFTSSAKDAMRMWSDFRVSQAQADNLKADTIRKGVDTDLLRKKGPEAELDSRFYNFLNSLIDRFRGSSVPRRSRVVPKDKLRLVPQGYVDDGRSWNSDPTGN